MFVFSLILQSFIVVNADPLIANLPERPGPPISAREFELARYLAPIERRESSIDNLLAQSQYFEGDINHPGLNARTFSQLVDQSNFALDQVHLTPEGVHRAAIRNPFRHWTDGLVPYTISNQYSSSARRRIAAAIEEFHKETCIRFIPRSSESSYVYIQRDRGCYSSVGRLGGRQTVSLGSGCLRHGIIIHELMHSLGFFHEQSRSDRDEYIRINFHNIKSGMDGNFQKKSVKFVTNLGLEYDYGSVLHYGRRAFSKNRQDTVVPLKRGARIGQREGFSSTDIQKINKLYKCSSTRPRPVPRPKPRPTGRPWTRPQPRPTRGPRRPWSRSTPRPTRRPMPRPKPRPHPFSAKSIFSSDVRKFLERMQKYFQRFAG